MTDKDKTDKVCKVCKLKITDMNFKSITETEFVHTGYCSEFIQTLNESDMDVDEIQLII